jgi:hypothetical protein
MEEILHYLGQTISELGISSIHSSLGMASSPLSKTKKVALVGHRRCLDLGGVCVGMATSAYLAGKKCGFETKNWI